MEPQVGDLVELSSGARLFVIWKGRVDVNNPTSESRYALHWKNDILLAPVTVCAGRYIRKVER